jgi:hypothetical protein
MVVAAGQGCGATGDEQEYDSRLPKLFQKPMLL